MKILVNVTDAHGGFWQVVFVFNSVVPGWAWDSSGYVLNWGNIDNAVGWK